MKDSGSRDFWVSRDHRESRYSVLLRRDDLTYDLSNEPGFLVVCLHFLGWRNTFELTATQRFRGILLSYPGFPIVVTCKNREVPHCKTKAQQIWTLFDKSIQCKCLKFKNTDYLIKGMKNSALNLGTLIEYQEDLSTYIAKKIYTNSVMDKWNYSLKFAYDGVY